MARAIGVVLPLQKGKTGYFAQSYDVLTQVKSNLINLLLTQKGERVMQPNFGSALHNLIFSPMDEEFNSRVENAIKDAVQQWMPFLDVTAVSVAASNDENRTDVKVSFALRSNASITDSIVISF